MSRFARLWQHAGFSPALADYHTPRITTCIRESFPARCVLHAGRGFARRVAPGRLMSPGPRAMIPERTGKTLQPHDRRRIRRGREGHPHGPRARGAEGRALRRRAAAGQSRRLLHRREGPLLRRRDLPAARRGDRHPRPHELARRRPGLPHRRRPRGHVPEVPGQGVRDLQGRARARPPGRRHATATARPTPRPSSPTASTTRPRASAPACWPATGEVWYTCIPKLWQLRDTEGDGQGRPSAIRCTRLRRARRLPRPRPARAAHGARRQALLQHRRPRLQRPHAARARTLAVPDTGAVLRCNPDGTELEVFATGLRNPQELAFDEYGNLFTGDNNSDSGDKARWVYLVEGGDSGWRIGYQFMRAVSRGPVERREALAPAPGRPRPAYLVPPIANIADGPSGLAYNPGVEPAARALQRPLLPRRFPRRQRPERHPLLRGQAEGGLVRAGRLRSEFVWSMLATDVDFGPDGALYYLRLGRGLGEAQQGADLSRARPGAARRSSASARSRRLLAEGMKRRIER